MIVADPNFAPMYATRSKKVKTDKRDARALCEACRLGAYRPAHRTSDKQRDVRAHLAVRETMVRTRSKYISLIGALARREGCRIPTGVSRSFAAALHEWATKIAARRGKATAVVALARKLAGILFALWRDGTEFDPGHRLAASGS